MRPAVLHATATRLPEVATATFPPSTFAIDGIRLSRRNDTAWGGSNATGEVVTRS